MWREDYVCSECAVKNMFSYSTGCCQLNSVFATTLAMFTHISRYLLKRLSPRYTKQRRVPQLQKQRNILWHISKDLTNKRMKLCIYSLWHATLQQDSSVLVQVSSACFRMSSINLVFHFVSSFAFIMSIYYNRSAFIPFTFGLLPIWRFLCSNIGKIWPAERAHSFPVSVTSSSILTLSSFNFSTSNLKLYWAFFLLILHNFAHYKVTISTDVYAVLHSSFTGLCQSLLPRYNKPMRSRDEEKKKKFSAKTQSVWQLFMPNLPFSYWVMIDHTVHSCI